MADITVNNPAWLTQPTTTAPMIQTTPALVGQISNSPSSYEIRNMALTHANQILNSPPYFHEFAEFGLSADQQRVRYLNAVKEYFAEVLELAKACEKFLLTGQIDTNNNAPITDINM